MKKILTLIAVGILALGVSHAGDTKIEFFNSYNMAHSINLADDQGLVSTLGGGYVVAYWLSATGGDDVTSYQSLGISGFLDLAHGSAADGYFSYTTGMLDLVPASGEATYYLGMTIFRVDDVSNWGEFFGDLNSSLGSAATQTALTNMWLAAEAATSETHQTGQWWNAQVTFDNLGDRQPEDLFGVAFGWNGQKQFLSAEPIPEPSTWLLLGAGAAFVMILRRRKKNS